MLFFWVHTKNYPNWISTTLYCESFYFIFCFAISLFSFYLLPFLTLIVSLSSHYFISKYIKYHNVYFAVMKKLIQKYNISTLIHNYGLSLHNCIIQCNHTLQASLASLHSFCLSLSPVLFHLVWYHDSV